MSTNASQQEPIVINGKAYPLWSQFVHRQSEWIGGTLEDHDMGQTASTKITGIELRPNGDDSAYFEIKGEKFSCGFDVRYGGIGSGARGHAGWLIFHGYGGHWFCIKAP